MQRRGVSALAGSLLSARRISTLSGHLPGGLSSVSSRQDPVEAGENTDGRSNSARGCVLFGAAAAAAGVTSYSVSSQLSPSQCDAAQAPALNPNEFIPFKLKHIETLNHNTKIYRFELQPGQKLGLTVASCLVTKAAIGAPNEQGNPKPVIRPYTPITQPDVEGYFDLLVKVYPTGAMSTHIDSLRPGDTLEMKGPIPKLAYTPNLKKSIGMVAGGTGITPMLQVIDAVLNNPNDDTQLSLVFANTSPADILLRKKLEEYAIRHPNFKVFFLVDKASPREGWKGGVGFVTAGLLKKAMPPPSDDSLVLVCGPPGMMKHVSGGKAKDKSQGEVEGLLKDLGYAKEQVYKF